MENERIKVPKGVIVIDRPVFRGRRFTRVEIDQILRKENEERYTKRVLQCIRRQTLAANPRLGIEIQKLASVEKLKASFLQELAAKENATQGLSQNTKTGGCQMSESLLDKKTHEIMQALMTLVEGELEEGVAHLTR
jgi:hypothetical protein